MVLKKVDIKAAKAKARMAKRAKRARFFRENKKRLLMIFLGFLLIVFLLFGTPWGPNYYYMRIQEQKMENPGTVAPGYLRKLYNLGIFYAYTMRGGDALRCFNEIGTLYYGFSIMDYAQNPEGAEDKRFEAEKRIRKGLGNGPPFKVPEEDIKYVGYAIYEVGELIRKEQSRQFPYRIYQGLYLDNIMKEHPLSCDPEITRIVTNYVDRFTGRR